MTENKNNILGFEKLKPEELDESYEKAAKIWKEEKNQEIKKSFARELTQEEKSDSEEKIKNKRQEIESKYDESKKTVEDKYSKQRNEITKKKKDDEARDGFFERTANEREEERSKKENDTKNEIQQKKDDSHKADIANIKKQSNAPNFADNQDGQQNQTKRQHLFDEDYSRLAHETIKKYGSKGGNANIGATADFDEIDKLQLERISVNEQYALAGVEGKRMKKNEKLNRITKINPNLESVTFKNQKMQLKVNAIQNHVEAGFFSQFLKNLSKGLSAKNALKRTHETFNELYKKEEYGDNAKRIATIKGVHAVARKKIVKYCERTKDEEGLKTLIEKKIKSKNKNVNVYTSAYSELSRYKEKYGKVHALNTIYENNEMRGVEEIERQKNNNKADSLLKNSPLKKIKLLGI